MIKFFRKIRQNLLSEGQTGKYFKYAIGEILLVVIGILIAIQINDFKDQQKQYKEEQIILKNFLNDLQNDVQTLNNVIGYNEFLMSTIDSISIGLNNPNTYSIEEFLRHNKVFPFIGIFESTSVTFSECTSTGKLSLIRDDQLRRDIVGYYKYSGESVDGASENYMNIHILPNWYSAFAGTQEQAIAVGSKRINLPKLDLEEVSSNKRYQNALAIKYTFMKQAIQSWNSRKQRVAKLIVSLKKQINL